MAAERGLDAPRSFAIGVGVASGDAVPYAFGAGYNRRYTTFSSPSDSLGAKTVQAWVYAVRRPVPRVATLVHTVMYGAYHYATLDDTHPGLRVAGCQFNRVPGADAALLPAGWELAPAQVSGLATEIIGRHPWGCHELVLQVSERLVTDTTRLFA